LGQQPTDVDCNVRHVPEDDNEGRRQEPAADNYGAPADPVVQRKRRRPAGLVGRRPRASRRGGQRRGHVRIFDQHSGHAAVGGLSDGGGPPRRSAAPAASGLGRAADVR